MMRRSYGTPILWAMVWAYNPAQLTMYLALTSPRVVSKVICPSLPFLMSSTLASVRISPPFSWNLRA